MEMWMKMKMSREEGKRGTKEGRKSRGKGGERERETLLIMLLGASDLGF